MTPEPVSTGHVPTEGAPGPAGGDPARGPSPVFLLADSQLLFRAEAGGRFMDRIATCAGSGAPRAAYLGASNGDAPEYYALFLAAMEAVGPARCRMIPGAPAAEDLAFLEAADVILLAGGDVALGWRAFQASGVREVVERRYHAGAVLVGVSAGAVQLGTYGWPEGHPESPFPTWGLVPFVVDAHAESEDWADLAGVVRARGEGTRGIGIPSGAGLVYHPDGSVEAIRHALAELSLRDGALARAVVLPPTQGPRHPDPAAG